MKITLISSIMLLLQIQSYSQIQIGSDILGTGPNDYFANVIAADATGDIVAIRGSLSDSRRGRVEIYQFENDDWTQLGQVLVGNDLDYFGYNLALSGDGNTLIIGAPQIFFSTEGNGYVNIYKLEGNS